MTEQSAREALFIGYHHWESVRRGGMHYFAAALLENEWNIHFVTFHRPLYGLFKTGDQFGLKNFKLFFFEHRYVANHSCFLRSWVAPLLALPRIFVEIIPNKISSWFKSRSFPPLWLLLLFRNVNPSVIIVESCNSVLIVEYLRRRYPNSKIVYRPSDPLFSWSTEMDLIEAELKLFQTADLVLHVNHYAARAAQQMLGSDLEFGGNTIVLENGYDEELVSSRIHENPYLNGDINLVYLGAQILDDELISRIAVQRPKWNFWIINPTYKKGFRSKVPNLFFLGGLDLEKSMGYIEYATVFISPNKIGRKVEICGITSKILLAMRFGIPIVAMNTFAEDPRIEGIHVVEKEEDFIRHIDTSICHGHINYPKELLERTWTEQKVKFKKMIETLFVSNDIVKKT